ncbi:MAG: exosortase/archaeosortase family protein [Bacteroidota bacterium]
MKFDKNLLKEILTDPRWSKVRAVFWFCLITIGIHIGWRFWAINLDYFPVRNAIVAISTFFVDHLFNQSLWVVTHVLNIKIDTVANAIYCENGAGIRVVESCSGVKQILQFALLMLIFPGPWKHKLWYIPLGMFIVHLTNVLRIVLLVVVAKNSPANIEYFHNNWLRFMFYVVIFGLWVLWVEKIADKETLSKDGQ